jgi:hypothetical protein
MFIISGINATAGTVLPETRGASGSGPAMSFTESIATLAGDGVTFFATTGRSALG